jgi:hypothetical protein
VDIPLTESPCWPVIADLLPTIGGMKCPHCLVTFDDSWDGWQLCTDEQATWRVQYTICSACKLATIALLGSGEDIDQRVRMTVWPKGATRPAAPEVPEPYAGDFREACLVLPDSTNASAAISRRCLQSLLVNEGEAKKGRLVDQIGEVVESKQLRPQLADNLHYVRKVGNLGAHEIKNEHTGEVVDATQEEAEWLIEVLEGLFEHYFVEPRREQKRREGFDARMEAVKAAPAPVKEAEIPATATVVKGQGQSTQIDSE